MIISSTTSIKGDEVNRVNHPIFKRGPGWCKGLVSGLRFNTELNAEKK